MLFLGGDLRRRLFGPLAWPNILHTIPILAVFMAGFDWSLQHTHAFWIEDSQ